MLDLGTLMTAAAASPFIFMGYVKFPGSAGGSARNEALQALTHDGSKV